MQWFWKICKGFASWQIIICQGDMAGPLSTPCTTGRIVIHTICNVLTSSWDHYTAHRLILLIISACEPDISTCLVQAFNGNANFSKHFQLRFGIYPKNSFYPSAYNEDSLIKLYRDSIHSLRYDPSCAEEIWVLQNKISSLWLPITHETGFHIELRVSVSWFIRVEYLKPMYSKCSGGYMSF